MSKEEMMYLAIGIEDGWIHCTPKVWKEYLVIKELLNNVQ